LTFGKLPAVHVATRCAMATSTRWNCVNCNLSNSGNRTQCQACFTKRIQTTCTQSLYAVGKNHHNELGIDTDPYAPDSGIVSHLTKINHFANQAIPLRHIYCSASSTTFLANDDCLYISGQSPLTDHCQQSGDFIPINYFARNHFKIKQLCHNIIAKQWFVLTDSRTLYAIGENNHAQLGLGYASPSKHEFTKVPHVDDLVIRDVACCVNLSLLLCVPYASAHVLAVIASWTRFYELPPIPPDLMQQIVNMTQKNEVYAAGVHAFDVPPSIGGYHATLDLRQKQYSRPTFQRVHVFEDKHIVKIACGPFHALFLEENGMIWACGENRDAQLGLEGVRSGGYVYRPSLIEWFQKHAIKIVDISCGVSHNLALSEDGLVYSWGLNSYGECGQGEDVVYQTRPHLIRALSEYRIVEIKCGAFHSYVKDHENRYFLFGANELNQCGLKRGGDVDDDHEYEESQSPVCINKTVKTLCNQESISGVFLGDSCTFILTQM